MQNIKGNDHQIDVISDVKRHEISSFPEIDR